MTGQNGRDRPTGSYGGEICGYGGGGRGGRKDVGERGK